MKINEVMKASAEVITHDRTVEEAAKLMLKGNYGGLPVEQDDKMIGMITDRDIVIRVIAQGKDPKTTKVSESMSEGISYCYEDDEIESVARKMAVLHHRRLPVVNRNKRLVGIVSLVDIAKKANNAKITHDILS